MSLHNGRRAAVFACEGGVLSLFASRAIDQTVLNAVEEIWTAHRVRFQDGGDFHWPDPQQGRPSTALVAVLRDAVSLAMVPASHDGQLQGLLYLDSLDPRLGVRHEVRGLMPFAQVAGRAVALGESSSIHLPSDTGPSPGADPVAREELLVLMERHEWNISRVARILAVSRRTVYLRLDRLGIQRRRISKAVRD